MFCPSCAAKRAPIFGALLREEILEEVGHAQWVFTIPKLLRPYFLHHRELLGKGLATMPVTVGFRYLASYGMWSSNLCALAANLLIRSVITDVTVSYPMNLTTQMLEFSGAR